MKDCIKTLTIIFVFFPAFLPADDNVRRTAPSEDVWIVDTRFTSWTRGSEEDFKSIAYFRHQGNHWKRSDAETFFGSQNPTVPLIVFSPGYTSTVQDNINVANELVQKTKGRTCRIVIWNWPSERVYFGLRKDIRSKISVAEANGRYLAMFLENLHAESRVCLFAFSFGNRIVCDALEIFDKTRPPTMKLYLVLGAPAIDADSLNQGGRNERVPHVVDKTLLFYNPRDLRLAFYPFLYGPHYRTVSLGQYGPLDNHRELERTTAINTSSKLKRLHQTLLLMNIKPFNETFDEYFLFSDL